MHFFIFLENVKIFTVGISEGKDDSFFPQKKKKKNYSTIIGAYKLLTNLRYTTCKRLDLFSECTCIIVHYYYYYKLLIILKYHGFNNG